MTSSQNGSETGTAGPDRPLLRIVRGDPSAHELAALLAVVGAYAAPAAKASKPKAASAWSAPAATMRRPQSVGLGMWVTSGWQAGVRTRAHW